MPFDPTKPFEVVGTEPTGFDPNQPFTVVAEPPAAKAAAPAFDPSKPFEVVQAPALQPVTTPARDLVTNPPQIQPSPRPPPTFQEMDPAVALLIEHGKAARSSLYQTGRGASAALEGLAAGAQSTAEALGLEAKDSARFGIVDALKAGAADSRAFYEEKLADPALQQDPSIRNATYAERPFAKAGLAATSQALPFATGLAASAAAGNPAPMMALYATTGYGDTYANAKQAGASETAAQTTAMVNAAWQGISERFGIGGLLEAPKRTILANIAAGATRESIQEAIQTIGSNIIESIGYDAGRQWTEGLADAIAGAFVLGAGGGATIRPGQPPAPGATGPTVQAAQPGAGADPNTPAGTFKLEDPRVPVSPVDRNAGLFQPPVLDGAPPIVLPAAPDPRVPVSPVDRQAGLFQPADLGGAPPITLPGPPSVLPTPPAQSAAPESAIDTIAGRMSLTEFEQNGYTPDQVTRTDWINLQRAERRRLGQPEGGDSPNAPNAEYEEYHRAFVADAVAKGEAVDPEVLKDYPDLSKPVPPTVTHPIADDPRDKHVESMLKLKGVVSHANNLYFIPDNLMTVERRRKISRPGDVASSWANTGRFEIKPWAEVTGNAYDKGYAVIDVQARKASRASQPPLAPPPAPVSNDTASVPFDPTQPFTVVEQPTLIDQPRTQKNLSTERAQINRILDELDKAEAAGRGRPYVYDDLVRRVQHIDTMLYDQAMGRGASAYEFPRTSSRREAEDGDYGGHLGARPSVDAIGWLSNLTIPENVGFADLQELSRQVEDALAAQPSRPYATLEEDDARAKLYAQAGKIETRLMEHPDNPDNRPAEVIAPTSAIPVTETNPAKDVRSPEPASPNQAEGQKALPEFDRVRNLLGQVEIRIRSRRLGKFKEEEAFISAAKKELAKIGVPGYAVDSAAREYKLGPAINGVRNTLSAHQLAILLEKNNDIAKELTAMEKSEAAAKQRATRVAGLPVSQRRNGWEIVNDGVDYVVLDPQDKMEVYRGTLQRSREVADEAKPKPLAIPPGRDTPGQGQSEPYQVEYDSAAGYKVHLTFDEKPYQDLPEWAKAQMEAAIKHSRENSLWNSLNNLEKQKNSGAPIAYTIRREIGGTETKDITAMSSARELAERAVKNGSFYNKKLNGKSQQVADELAAAEQAREQEAKKAREAADAETAKLNTRNQQYRDLIAGVKLPAAKAQTIKAKMVNGATRELTGQVIGPWIIQKQEGSKRDGTWYTVSNVAGGIISSPRLRTLADAKNYVKSFIHHNIDASYKEPSDISEKQKGLMLQIKAFYSDGAPAPDVADQLDGAPATAKGKKSAKATSPLQDRLAEVRSKVPEGTVIAHRLGDFYEFFDQDAEIASKVLGITLTKRQGVRMAGVPYHDMLEAQSKLVYAGVPVAISENNKVEMVKQSPSPIYEPLLQEVSDTHEVHNIQRLNPFARPTSGAFMVKGQQRDFLVSQDGLILDADTGIPVVRERINAWSDIIRQLNVSDQAKPGGAGAAGPADAPINSIPRAYDPDPPVLNGVRVDTNAPVGTGDIVRFIAKAFDVPLRVGGFRRAAEGFYRSFSENIRLKRANEIPVAFHELGHYLHNVVFPGNPDQDARGSRTQEYSTFGKRFDAELMPLGTPTSRPSYSEHQIRMEGVAEFLRVYMGNRADALTQAPTFTAHFEAETAKQPELRAAIDKAREMVTKWRQQPAGARIDAHIRTSEDGRRTYTPRQIVGNLYTKWVDQTAPITRTLENMVEAGASPGLARAIQARIVNFIGGWRGKVEHALNNRATNLRGQEVGEGLRTILRDAAQAAPPTLLAPGQRPLELFRRYVVAKHAKEDLFPRGIETGLNRSDVEHEVATLGPVFESHFRRLLAFQRVQRDLLVDAGVISRETARAMDAKHQWYVPFHRFHEGVAGRSRGGSGTGFINTPTGIRRMKGSTREILDPIETVIKNAYVFRELAERNRIGEAFARFLDTTRGGGRIGDQVSKKMAPTKVNTEEIVKMLNDAGVDPDLVEQVADAGPSGNIWRAIDSVKPRDGIFKVYRDGKEVHYQIDDGELYRAMTLADTTDAEILARFPFLRSFNWFTRLKRAGATLTPEFILRNPIRDQFAAAIYSKDGTYIPFVDMFRGMFHVLRKDGVYQKWVREGGRYAHMVGADKTNLQESLEEVMREPGAQSFVAEMMNPLHPIRTLQNISTLMEEATRVGMFGKALSSGASPIIAANLSKDGTLNFSRHGTHGKLVNMLSAFFNAGVQDMDKFVRAHTDRSTAPGVALRGFLYITIPSLLAWFLGKDDEEIQNLPGWRKNLAWNFRIPGLDGIWSLPKPFLLGAIYGSSVERALDVIYKDDPAAAGQWFDTVMSQLPGGGPGPKESLFIPPGMIPDVIKTAIEGMANYSFFRDGPIIPQRLLDLPKAEQYTETTSRAGRAVGQVTGISPMLVDNAIRNTFAGLGKVGLDVLDATIIKLSGEELPPSPARPAVETTPGLRAFKVPEGEASRKIEEFYTGIHNAEALWKAAAAKDPTKDVKWYKANQVGLLYYHERLPDLRLLADYMADLNTARRSVVGARDMTPAQKQAALVKLSQERERVAKAGVSMMLPADITRRR